MVSRLATVLLLASIAGCAPSLQEIRQEAPTKSAIYAGKYDEVGPCVAAGMQSADASEWETSLGSLTYEVIDQKRLRRMTITGRFSYRNLPLIDVSVSDEGGKSLIEIRRPGHRGGRIAEEKTWPIVEACVAELSK